MQQLLQQGRLLLAAIEEIRRSPGGFRAMIVRTSKLAAGQKSPGKMLLAARIFDVKTRGTNNALYLLPSGDMVFMGSDISSDELGQLAKQAAEAIAQGADGIGVPQDFAVIYRLDRQFDDFSKAAADMATLKVRAKKWAPVTNAPKLDAGLLEMLESRLPSFNITAALKTRDVFDLETRSAAFTEYYVSVDTLRAVLGFAGVDMLADYWLFSYVTTLFDSMMLRDFDWSAGHQAIALNLNLMSMGKLGQVLERPLIAKFSVPDVLMNYETYNGLSGVRKMISRITLTDMAALNCDAFNADFIQLFWSHEFILPENKKMLGEKIGLIGAGKIVLAGADSQDSITWGKRTGIRLYQGRAAEKEAGR
ncbi:MAG: hypothetical protein FWF01_00030 [Alphaproteobacteria bacterium]|nr:hypothetical protein [Alphaproteobacteria bacterium]